jgi:nucleotide-binding universal stress UspA family protein
VYSNILLPTDGSPGQGPVVERVIDLAETYGATVHALYVLDTDGLSGEISTAGLVAELEETGRDAVDEVLSAVRAADVATAEGAVRRGAPHREIVDYAEEHDVDLVVMGTHGRTGLPHLLLGSVAEKVVRTAACPVLTVRTAPAE